MQRIEYFNNKLSKFFTSKRSILLTVLLISCYVAALSTICVRKYWSFGYQDWDFATYTNVLWNLIHGNAVPSLLGHHFLYDHASIIAFLIAIPYYLFQHPLTLLILQTLSIGITALPIYLVAREKLDNFSAVITASLYLIYPAIYYANLYEFYFEIFSLPFLASAFYLLLKNKKILSLLMCALACACKENIPLTVIALGVFGLSRPRRRLLGLLMVMLGIVWFYFDLQILPALTGPKGVSAAAGVFGAGLKHVGNFARYGNNMQEIFMHLLSHPLEALKTMVFNGYRGRFFSGLLGVLLYLPILRPDVLLINLPHAAARLLGGNEGEYMIYFHSAAPMAPFVFFAFIFAVNTLLKRSQKLFTYRYYLLSAIFIFELVAMSHLWKTTPEIIGARFKYTGRDMVRESFVKEVPAEESVAATFEFLSHLAEREHIYSLHSMFGGNRWKWKPPKDLGFVLVDLNSRLMSTMFFESTVLLDKHLYPYLLDNNFGLVKARGDIFLFKRGYHEEPGLLHIIKSPETSSGAYSVKVDDDISLLKYEIKTLPDENGIMQIAFYWRKDGGNKKDYLMRFFITQDGRSKLCAIHILGYALLPPSQWEAGTEVKENYWLILPKIQPGEYKLSFDLIDLERGERADLSSSGREEIDRYGRYRLI